MREDFHKVLTERPRHGGGMPFPRRKKVFAESDHTKEGMTRRWVREYWAKGFSDHLGPLRRYIESRVGRSWDKTWSEICSVLPKGVMGRHLKGHVEAWVRTGQPDQVYPYSDFHVDAQGVLRREKPKPKRAPEKYNWAKSDRGTEFHKIHGTWFEVWDQEYEVFVAYGQPGELFYDPKAGYNQKRWRISRKRTLSKKEIRDLDLANAWTTFPPRRGLVN